MTKKTISRCILRIQKNKITKFNTNFNDFALMLGMAFFGELAWSQIAAGGEVASQESPSATPHFNYY